MGRKWDIASYQQMQNTLQHLTHELDHLREYIAQFDAPWSEEDLVKTLHLYRMANATVNLVPLQDAVNHKNKESIMIYYDFSKKSVVSSNENIMGMVAILTERLVQEQIKDNDIPHGQSVYGVTLKMKGPNPIEGYRWIPMGQVDSQDKLIVVVNPDNQVEWRRQDSQGILDLYIRAYLISHDIKEPMGLYIDNDKRTPVDMESLEKETTSE